MTAPRRAWSAAHCPRAEQSGGAGGAGFQTDGRPTGALLAVVLSRAAGRQGRVCGRHCVRAELALPTRQLASPPPARAPGACRVGHNLLRAPASCAQPRVQTCPVAAPRPPVAQSGLALAVVLALALARPRLQQDAAGAGGRDGRAQMGRLAARGDARTTTRPPSGVGGTGAHHAVATIGVGALHFVERGPRHRGVSG